MTEIYFAGLVITFIFLLSQGCHPTYSFCVSLVWYIMIPAAMIMAAINTNENFKDIN